MKSLISVVFISVIHLILSFYIAFSLDNIKFSSQSIFLADLFGRPAYLPFWTFYLISMANVFVLWLISKSYFNGKWPLLPSFIYSISLWPAYMVASNANSVITLFLFLITFVTFLKWKDGVIPSWLFAIPIGALYYFSFLPSFIALFILLYFLISNLLSNTQKKKLLLITLLMYIPILAGFIYNPTAINNLAKQQIKIFSEPGIINGLNTFKGESQKEGYYLLQKVVENKYLYLPSYFVLKTLKHLNLATYFTGHEKMLNFSINPPVYFGFTIPFIYGLYVLYNKLILNKYLLLGIVLIIPSILAQQLVDLQRLIIAMPLILFAISYGVYNLYLGRSILLNRIALWFTIILVSVQFLGSMVDISNREYLRFRRYFGPVHMEVGKQ